MSIFEIIGAIADILSIGTVLFDKGDSQPTNIYIGSTLPTNHSKSIKEENLWFLYSTCLKTWVFLSSLILAMCFFEGLRDNVSFNAFYLSIITYLKTFYIVFIIILIARIIKQASYSFSLRRTIRDSFRLLIVIFVIRRGYLYLETNFYFLCESYQWAFFIAIIYPLLVGVFYIYGCYYLPRFKNSPLLYNKTRYYLFSFSYLIFLSLPYVVLLFFN